MALPRHQKTKRIGYDAGEVKRLLEASVGDRPEAMWRLGISTTMRPGELFALRIEDVYLDRAIMTSDEVSKTSEASS